MIFLEDKLDTFMSMTLKNFIFGLFIGLMVNDTYPLKTD